MAQGVHSAVSRNSHPEWVQAPGMLVRAECVHEVPKGASVTIDGETVMNINVGGAPFARYDPCPEAPIITRPRGGPRSYSGPPQAATGGWVEAAQKDLTLEAGDGIDYLTGTWIVPPNPEPSEGSSGLIYLFNAIVPQNGGSILQPVLQWGVGPNTGSGNYWVISSWYVGSNNQALYSTPQKVSPGDTIAGNILLVNQAGGTSVWLVNATDTTTGADSAIAVATGGLLWTTAFAGALEAYNITSCSQFPPDRETSFQNAAVYHGYPNFQADATNWKGILYPWTGPSCGRLVMTDNTFAGFLY